MWQRAPVAEKGEVGRVRDADDGEAGSTSGGAPGEPGTATFQEFQRLDLRIGRIRSAEVLPGARKPAYRMRIDFGTLGQRQSSAQLPGTYPDPAALVGRLVVAVVNFPPRRIAGFSSEVLVLGALPADGRIPLLSVDPGASPGDRIG